MNYIALYFALSSVLNACSYLAAASSTSSDIPSTRRLQESIGDNRKENNKIKQENISRQHKKTRHLLESTTECVLYLKAVQYEDGRKEDSWSCEFSPSLARRLGGVEMMDIEGVSKEELDSLGAISGETILRVGTSAFVEQRRRDQNGKIALHIPPASNYAVEDMDSKIDIRHTRNRRSRLRHRRRLDGGLDESLDALKVLVVRVIDGAGIGPDPDAAALENDIFYGNVCLKSQFQACSHNQVFIEQATEFSTTQNNNVTVNGIVDVQVDVLAEEDNFNMLEIRALQAAESTYGTISSLADTFDIVMFCQPPGTGDWLAYAYINDWRSFYNNKWCQRVSAQMHEIGHNLNLAHSGLPNDSAYADKSGMMGFSYNDEGGPIQCYNPAKSFQLGWYSKQTLSIDPLDYIDEPKTFILNGVSDYKKDGSNGDALVSLRLELEGLEGGVDYYVGYNRQTGCNSGTEQVPNLVTITEKENSNTNFNGRDGYGLTRRIAALAAGESVTFSDYVGTTSDVTVTVNYIRGKSASITIITSAAEPTQAPTICNEGKLHINLYTDSFGRDTRWSIRDDETGAITVQSSGQYSSNTMYALPSPTSYYCMTPGICYTFTITDRQDDGICCQFGMGYYQLFLEGQLLFEGGDFDDMDVVQFCVPSAGDSDDNSEEEINAPSGSPTDTDGGNVEPTINPTASTVPTVDPSQPEECIDDPKFRYNGKRSKDCGWLGKKPKRKKKKTCKKLSKGIRVADSCQKTCGDIGVGPCK